MHHPLNRRHVCLALASWAATPVLAHRDGSPLNTALAIAAQYRPDATPLYISAMILSVQRRLATPELLARARASEVALRDAPTPMPGDWYRRAGYAALAEPASADGDKAAGTLAVQALLAGVADTPAGPRLTGLRPWTDDMYMPVLMLERTARLLPSAQVARVTEALLFALRDLSHRLQRPDGLFTHADGSPIAWGRGNGFASLALAQALAGPLARAQPPDLVAALQRHLRALLPLQTSDGSWRQVLDQPQAPLELTVTAMSLTSLVLARHLGWLPAAEVDASIARAWQAVQRRVGEEGRLADVCAGTPAGPTLDFYLQRPITHGRDDRAAAMVLQASLALAGR